VVVRGVEAGGPGPDAHSGRARPERCAPGARHGRRATGPRRAVNRRWADGPPAVFEILASGPALRRLAVAGEIDILTAPDLARFLHHHLDDVMPGTTVAVDLSRVTLLSAVGIGVLVQVAGDARQKGVRMVVDPTSPHVRRMLELTGVHLAPNR